MISFKKEYLKHIGLFKVIFFKFLFVGKAEMTFLTKIKNKIEFSKKTERKLDVRKVNPYKISKLIYKPNDFYKFYDI